MSPREWVQLSGLFLLLLGIAVSVYGTFLLTRWYHSDDTPGLISTLWDIVWYTVTFRPKKIEENAATQVMFSGEEDRTISLVGIYWIFLGFAFQGLGTVIQLADFFYGVTHPAKPPCAPPC